MFTILLDEQLTGYVGYFRTLAESDAWKVIAQLLDVRFTNFPEMGLAVGTVDLDLTGDQFGEDPVRLRPIGTLFSGTRLRG